MTKLIIGKPDSGKSRLAESFMDSWKSGKKYYIATMIPYGEEGKNRVKKHRDMRAGKNFETVEQASNLYALEEMVTKEDALLLECVSNLVGNEIYEESHKDWDDDQIIDFVVDEITSLCGRAGLSVIVSNEFETDDSYDAETNRYILITKKVNEILKSKGFINEII